VIAGNHKPTLRTVDESIRRRFNMVPFTVTIGVEERDPGLKDKLRQEWPGIMSWMIEGCLEWQRIGLAPPKAVTAATDAYLQAEDALAAWMDEECELDPQAYEGATSLFGSWKAWAEKAGEAAGSSKSLSQTLVNRGFTSKRARTGTIFSGIRIRPSSFHGRDK
jgi:putative DNA primase/helicase